MHYEQRTIRETILYRIVYRREDHKEPSGILNSFSHWKHCGAWKTHGLAHGGRGLNDPPDTA